METCEESSHSENEVVVVQWLLQGTLALLLSWGSLCPAEP